MSKAYTREEVDKMIEEFNVYLGDLLKGFGLDDNPPMRACLVQMIENQLLSGLRRWMRADDAAVVSEQAAIELTKTVVAKYNLLRNAMGQPPIFVLEDLFSKELVQKFWDTLSDLWTSSDKITREIFCSAIEAIVKEHWETVVSRAAEINVEVELEPVVIMIVQLFMSQKSQHSLIVKLVPREAWTDARIVFERAKAAEENPHAGLLEVVKKYELAIIDRCSEWRADLEPRYLAYMMEHLFKSKFDEIPKPQLVL